MNETTSETAGTQFELVAQAARLVAPAAHGAVRRVLPVPPPPPSVWAAASASLPVAKTERSSPPSDAAKLRAWEEAAENLEPDWATPVDDIEDASEHTAPLSTDTNAEALSIVEANVTAKKPVESADAKSDPSDVTSPVPTPTDPKPEEENAESDLEALARSVTKSALHTLASRSQAPGRPLPKAPGASRAPVPPPPPPLAANRTPLPIPIASVARTVPGPIPVPVATVTRSSPSAAPVPVATVTRPALPPLAPPASNRPLPPLNPAPSRPPASSGFRASPVAPPASSRPAPSRPPPSVVVGGPRAQLPTLPRMADLEPKPALAAPSLLELRRSPAARRFYAQLGVAALFGALLATILFALMPRRTTEVSVVAAQPASTPEATAAPAAIAPKSEAPEARDTIPPPPPVANLSVDDLERERTPSAETNAQPKTAAPRVAPVAALAGLPSPAQAQAAAPPAEPAVATAPKPEAAAVSAKGTLHINAVPAANIAIDGRPIGMTPKIVRLAPGSHRVALIGPNGRRSQTVNVAAGQTATVSVKF